MSAQRSIARQNRMSRRDLLRRAAQGAGAIGAAGLLSKGMGLSAAGAQTPKSGGTLIVGMEAEISSFDPAVATGTSTSRPISNIFDPLVNTFGNKSEIQADLAQSWRVADDASSITMKLRPGVKFQDGTSVNAEAVVVSFERMLNKTDPDYFGPYTFPPFFFSAYRHVTAVDPLTVRFDLNRPDVTFLAELAWVTGAIVSPTAVKQLGRDFATKPVGTGAFKFVSWEKNVKSVLERFDGHWRGAPRLDRIILKPVIEEAQRFNQLASGEVDLITSLDPQFVPAVEANPGLRLIQTPSLHTWWVFFNMHEKHFQDKRVRQALNHAIDKEAIIKSILRGTGVLSRGWCWPHTWAYTPDVVTYPYDPKKAKELLAAAGYPNGFDVDYYVPESGSGMIAPKEIATVMQANLKQIGVNARITTEEWISYIATYRKGLDNIHGKQFGMAQRSWLNPTDDPGTYANYVSSGPIDKSANLGYYSNAAYDKLLADAVTTSDRAARARLYKQAQKIFAEDAPWIFMFHANYVIAARKNVQGVVLNPNQNVLDLRTAWKA
jgi:peptide/nickel transport system substrate-binding protein